jgi:hypothetical protein
VPHPFLDNHDAYSVAKCCACCEEICLTLTQHFPYRLF